MSDKTEYRQGDTDYGLTVKILNKLTATTNPTGADPKQSFRQGDSQRDLLKKILLALNNGAI